MTRPTNPVVAQVDREAAASLAAEFGWNGFEPDAMRSGRLDHLGLIKAFARHRQSADAALVEALEGSVVALDEAANVLADGYAGMARIVRGYADKARAAIVKATGQ